MKYSYVKPYNVIYDSNTDQVSGSVRVFFPWWFRLSYRLLSSVGAGLVAFFIVQVIFTFGPLAREEINYLLRQDEITQQVAEPIPDYATAKITEAEAVSKIQDEAHDWGVNSHFSIVIPKIGAASNIIANVDASDSNQYQEALSRGVAHAQGTYFPGQERNIFLFSHSTDTSPWNIARYNAVFYLIRRLEEGDRIYIYFADQKYEYEVETKVVTDPTETWWITDAGDKERLILMTCDPPGTTWRRLLVTAKPVKADQVLPAITPTNNESSNDQTLLSPLLH